MRLSVITHNFVSTNKVTTTKANSIMATQITNTTRSAIFSNAWQIAKSNGIKFGAALRKAWAVAKGVVSGNAIQAMKRFLLHADKNTLRYTTDETLYNWAHRVIEAVADLNIGFASDVATTVSERAYISEKQAYFIARGAVEFGLHEDMFIRA